MFCIPFDYAKTTSKPYNIRYMFIIINIYIHQSIEFPRFPVLPLCRNGKTTVYVYTLVKLIIEYKTIKTIKQHYDIMCEKTYEK